MNQPPNQQCINCRFFAVNGIGEGPYIYGFCRRHSPVVGDSIYIPSGKFPTVSPNEWCGDYEQQAQKEEPNAK